MHNYKNKGREIEKMFGINICNSYHKLKMQTFFIILETNVIKYLLLMKSWFYIFSLYKNKIR